MELTRFRSTALLLLALVPAPARSQENLELGKMWTVENPPLAYLRDEYGFSPTREWFDALRLASIRFGGGCSSSFVSPKGLIMTNHHCVRDEIAEVQGDDDWVRDGFYATTLADEVRIPGLTVQQLVAMEDVTAEYDAGVTADDDDATAADKRRANGERILARARKETPEYESQLVKLYQGAQVELYRYRIWDDIRLVCSPHLQISHFGGDYDNFTYPRYCLDFSFVRAWSNGAPADTSAHYFRWNTDGVEPGELVFVTGNPGTTRRLLTKAQMEYLRDAYHPIVDELIDSRLAIRRQLVEENPSREKELRTEILSWENTQKAYDGYWAGLLDASLMAQKERAERAFRERVAADPELRQRYGRVWDVLADVAQARRTLEAPLRFHQSGGHPVLQIAERVVRAWAADGDARERLAAGARGLRERIASEGLDRLAVLEFADHLHRARHWLPADDPYCITVLGDRSPEQVNELLARSPLLDATRLDALLADGRDIASLPPAIHMVQAYLPMADRHAAENKRLASIEDTQGALIGRALFATYGTSVSPDATLTLRFSDGIVAGYPCNGTRAPHRTTFHGLFDRNAAFDDTHPFDLPQIWKDRVDRLDLTTSMVLVSTNDIIGGNSGSPLVNANLEVVGLVFDGNIEMLPNRYVYRSDLPRSVSVHTDGILEALRKIYDAQRIVAELVGE
ncbi:MAG: S46 family peptidase [Planctomycetes bacterium]|nr:S46 family peptidase [Planctomycetota bacterium]